MLGGSPANKSHHVSPLEPPYRLIREGLLRGEVIPFLGAGASGGNPSVNWEKGRSDCPPTTAQLSGLLASAANFPVGESLELAKVAQYLHLVGGRKRLHRELHQIFDSNYDPSPVHQFLADLDAPLLIVTTNYDDLIDRALTRRDRKYELVIHTTNPTLSCRVLWRRHDMSAPDDISPNRLQLDLGNLTIVYKMHGAVDRQDPERDQYVITEDDYVDFLTRMTRNRAVPAMIQDAFRLRSVPPPV